MSSSSESEKAVLTRLMNNTRKVTNKKLPPDPSLSLSSTDEPLTVEDLLGIVQVLNNLSADIEAFKQRINEKLTVVTEKKKSYVVETIMIRHLFLFSFAWQFVNVLWISFFEEKIELSKNQNILVMLVMILFQLIHMFLVFGTSIKLCRRVLHQEASPLFVAQSFLSSVLLYAGIYHLLNFAYPDSFTGITSPSHFVRAVNFLYYSTATMTTVGYGDITANTWFAQLIVSSQMMISVTFTVIIFAQGLAHFNTPYIIPKKRGERAEKEENHYLLWQNSEL